MINVQQYLASRDTEQSPHASTGPDPYPASAPSGDIYDQDEIEQLTNATGWLE